LCRHRSLDRPDTWLVAVATLVVLLAARDGLRAATNEQPAMGTICVAPQPVDPTGLASPGFEYDPATLAFQIDKRAITSWPHDEGVTVENLERTEKHLVVIRSKGKNIQSFWFRFDEYKSDRLCLEYDGYQGPQLRTPSRLCACQK